MLRLASAQPGRPSNAPSRETALPPCNAAQHETAGSQSATPPTLCAGGPLTLAVAGSWQGVPACRPTVQSPRPEGSPGAWCRKDCGAWCPRAASRAKGRSIIASETTACNERGQPFERALAGVPPQRLLCRSGGSSHAAERFQITRPVRLDPTPLQRRAIIVISRRPPHHGHPPTPPPSPRPRQPQLAQLQLVCSLPAQSTAGAASPDVHPAAVLHAAAGPRSRTRTATGSRLAACALAVIQLGGTAAAALH